MLHEPKPWISYGLRPSLIHSALYYPKPLPAFGGPGIFISSLPKASFRRCKIKMPLQLRWKGICYPTWIRTKTSRTRICCTTVILSGNLTCRLLPASSNNFRGVKVRFFFTRRKSFYPSRNLVNYMIFSLCAHRFS